MQGIFNGTSNQIYVTGTSGSLSSGVSFVVVTAARSLSGIQTVFGRDRGGAAGGIELALANNFGSPSNQIFGSYNTTGGSQVGLVNGFVNGVSFLGGFLTATNTYYNISGSTGALNASAANFSIGSLNNSNFGSVNIPLFVVWKRALPAALLRQISSNPWQIFIPARRTVFFLPTNSDISLPFTVGNSVATGSAFALNQTIPTSVGNAVAAGSTFAVNEAIALGLSNAVAAGGGQAAVATSVVFGVGDAVAAGSGFAINQSLSALIGNAVAAGNTAAVVNYGAQVTWAEAQYQAASVVTVPMGIGNAVAAGLAFEYGAQVTWAEAQYQASANVTLPMFVGGASAAGQTAAIISVSPIQCGIGNAVATGPVGATVFENVSIVSGVGNAGAAGQTFAITGNVSLNCTVGDANAAGQQCQVLPPLTVAPSATPGYAPKTRYRVRVGKRWVEVDPLDQVSVRRAYDLAQEDAEQVAEQNVEQPAAVAKQAVVVQPIKGPDYAGLAKEARRISEDIRRVYADALQTALIARLMREQMDQDDEDDVAVLLASI